MIHLTPNKMGDKQKWVIRLGKDEKIDSQLVKEMCLKGIYSLSVGEEIIEKTQGKRGGNKFKADGVPIPHLVENNALYVPPQKHLHKYKRNRKDFLFNCYRD